MTGTMFIIMHIIHHLISPVLSCFCFFSSLSLTPCSAWWAYTWPRAMWQVPWPCSATSWSRPFPPLPSRPFLAVSSAATVYLCCVVFSSTPPFTIYQTDSPAQVSNLGGGEKIPSFVVYLWVVFFLFCFLVQFSVLLFSYGVCLKWWITVQIQMISSDLVESFAWQNSSGSILKKSLHTKNKINIYSKLIVAKW